MRITPDEVGELLSRHVANGELRLGRRHMYFEPLAALAARGSPIPFFAAMGAVWQLRHDLQALYPLNTHAQRFKFILWCLFIGSKEYRALEECRTEQVLNELYAPVSDARRPGEYTPKLLEWLPLVRPDLEKAFPAGQLESSRGLLYWYLTCGVYELGLDNICLPSWLHEYLNDPAPVVQDAGILVTRLMLLAYQCRGDVRASIDITVPTGRAQLARWFYYYGVEELRLQPYLHDGSHDRTASKRKKLRGRALRSGLNLVGFAFGELGIGEDVRMASRSCAAARIPHIVHNIIPGSSVAQRDTTLRPKVRDTLPYRVNIFCLTGFETLRVFLERGSAFFDGRFNVGYWPWELPSWPPQWKHVFALVDELWSSSRYTQSAFLRDVKQVRHMPMAVEVAPARARNRQSFGLPDDAFIFVFSFDCNSSLERKNPIGVIRAFQRAFAKRDKTCSLVLKAMNVNRDARSWKLLEQYAKRDERILIIKEVFSRADVQALYRVCDCFISLHRAEGFGRGIAEAMLLGLPVVVTAATGNMEFTKPNNSFLVPARKRKVREREYRGGAGQSWFDPDLSYAVRKLRVVAAQKELIGRVAKAGMRRIKAFHSPVVIGLKMSRALSRRLSRR
jgi:glycosyltransferase involved in cell wall biosynthesis